MNRQTALLASLSLVCIVAAVCFKSCQPVPVEFNSVEACKDHLESNGFHCVRVADHEFSYLVISNAHLTLEEARIASMKHQSANTPGIARARLLHHDFLPDCPNLRLWGKVYVFGDLDVINRVDPR